MLYLLWYAGMASFGARFGVSNVHNKVKNLIGKSCTPLNPPAQLRQLRLQCVSDERRNLGRPLRYLLACSTRVAGGVPSSPLALSPPSGTIYWESDNSMAWIHSRHNSAGTKPHTKGGTSRVSPGLWAVFPRNRFQIKPLLEYAQWRPGWRGSPVCEIKLQL